MKAGSGIALFCLAVLTARAPAVAQAPAEEIFAPIRKSAEDWNRGDLEAFMQSYEQSPQRTFVGADVARGTGAVLSRYKRSYPDADHMGKTTFSELQARPLTADLAIVKGRYNKSGIFTLVMRRGANGWRIIHDHTS